MNYPYFSSVLMAMTLNVQYTLYFTVMYYGTYEFSFGATFARCASTLLSNTRFSKSSGK